jgi:hypothetical protein
VSPALASPQVVSGDGLTGTGLFLNTRGEGDALIGPKSAMGYLERFGCLVEGSIDYGENWSKDRRNGLRCLSLYLSVYREPYRLRFLRQATS